MRRCRRTDALLDATFAGADLTREQGDHAAACAECAHALAQVRRFDGELRRVGSVLVDVSPPALGALAQPTSPLPRGRLMSLRTSMLGGLAAAVILALVVFGGGAWIGSFLSGSVQLGGISSEELDAWVDRTLEIALEESERPRGLQPGWEPAQIETCGQTAVVFYAQGDHAGYVWAIGRPDSSANRPSHTGWSMFLTDTTVAGLRALLPVCDMVLGGGDPSDELMNAVPVAPQNVVVVPEFWWEGPVGGEEIVIDGIGRSILIEGGDELVGRAGVHAGAFVYGVIDNPSVRAVDLITRDGRLRYTVGPPGFVVQTDLGDALRGFELLDTAGSVLASGPMREVAADRQAHEQEIREARAAAVAEAARRRAGEERRALEEGVDGVRCGDWREMSDLEQLAITEVHVPDLERVPLTHEIPADASDVIVEGRGRIDEECRRSPDQRTVAEIARMLYGGD